MPVYAYILAALFAYLLGSVPTGFLVARAKGVDIRSVGSGNIGATNVFRAIGKGLGIVVLLMDFGKGLGACVLVPVVVRALFRLSVDDPGALTLPLISGVCAVLGHNFTIWLRFKGGKGVATTAGALTALVPWALLIGLAVWAVLFALTRYVSLGSVAAAAVIPVATWLTTGGDVALTILTSALGVMVLLKHRSNLRRLLAGTEHRIEWRRKSA